MGKQRKLRFWQDDEGNHWRGKFSPGTQLNGTSFRCKFSSWHSSAVPHKRMALPVQAKNSGEHRSLFENRVIPAEPDTCVARQSRATREKPNPAHGTQRVIPAEPDTCVARQNCATREKPNPAHGTQPGGLNVFLLRLLSFILRPLSFFVVLLLPFCTGCLLADRFHVEKNLMKPKPTVGQVENVLDCYRMGCPDVVEVRMSGRPDLHFRAKVNPDGRLSVPLLGNPRVEGKTIAEITTQIARFVGLPSSQVFVNVVEYNSRQVFLFGQISGSHRSLPYKGPETVLSLLQRAGGITPGAEPGDVYVVRSNLAKASRPEVFHVHLRDIAIKKDYSTNIRIQPFDQIHIGETRQALVERCIPPWLRPLHQCFWDTHPPDWHPRSLFRKKLNNARH